MIEKLNNGVTLITLGQGTVYSGIARSNEDGLPIGICFTNEKIESGTSKDAVVIQIYDMAGISSYIMSLVRLLESWDEFDGTDVSRILESLKKDLEPHLPK